jgi:F-type H+-transporting ATPase subunit a
MNNTNHIFEHVVPLVPAALIPFIISIETIGSYIRPRTLTVRLTENIITGHLLLTLVGNN